MRQEPQTAIAVSTSRFSFPPFFYPLFAIFIWTGNTIVTKAAATAIEPAAIAFYRWVLAGLVMSPFLLRAAWGQRAIIAKHWPRLALLGCLGMGMYQGLAYVAAKTTSAVNMGVAVALMPLMSALLSSLLAGEALTATRICGAGLSLAGLLVITTQGHPTDLMHGTAHIGDVFMLIAVISNALYGVLLKRWAIPLTTWLQLYVQVGFGILMLLPFWWYAPSSAITIRNLPLILYAAIAASMGAPFFWMKGVKQLGPARASMFFNLLPVFVAFAAFILLNEQLHPYHAAGAVLALAGVWWGQRQAGVVNLPAQLGQPK